MVENQVREVLAIWRQAHAERSDPRDARDRFVNLMRRRGWRYAFGGFKSAMVKGKPLKGLVAKFAYDRGDDAFTAPEWRIWNKAKPFKRGFLARCYAFEDGLLIQQHVGVECNRVGDCPEARRWAERFRILDWGMNHSHRSNGKPIFFDYDNKGSGWDAWKARRLTRSAA